MTIRRLITREILHRKLSFVLSVVSVVVAVGCLVAAVTLLHAYDLRTEQIIQAKIAGTEANVRARQAEAGKRAAELNESYRQITLKLGYNLLILPKEEKLIDFELRGAPSKYMPEESVDILSKSGIMTVRHLLPVLQQRQIVVFAGKRQEVFLIGVRGEVPLANRAAKKPLLAAVQPGEMIIGWHVHQELGVKVGDKVSVVDREFKVSRIHAARGSNDDSSVWIDLKAAQEVLDKEGKINGIMAINCIPCTRTRLSELKQDIVRILPGTQVRVKMTEAVIRYEARVRAADEANAQVTLARRRGRSDIAREQAARADLKGQIEAFAGWIVPLILIGAAVWMALLAYGNVRQRRCEIGVLRAIGLRSGQILTVFLAKAVVVGLAGACVGYVAGFLTALVWGQAPPARQIFIPLLPVAVLLLAPVLSCLASWVPAMLAARQDPAAVLAEE